MQHIMKRLMKWIFGAIFLPGLLLLFIVVIAAAATESSIVAVTGSSGASDSTTIPAVGEGNVPADFRDGDAVFVGVDDNANAIQSKICRAASTQEDPFTHGYFQLCEAWVQDTYHMAELAYNGQCCASRSRDMNAIKKGKIPAGAVIYSGASYRTIPCPTCGKASAGHVAIYIGGGNIAGSQPPYIMSLDAWISIYGYGGWSFSGNDVLEKGLN